MVYDDEFDNAEDDAEIEQPFQLNLLGLPAGIASIIHLWGVAGFRPGMCGVGHKSQHIDSEGLGQDIEVVLERSLLLLFVGYLLAQLVASAALLGREVVSEFLLDDFDLIWVRGWVPLA